MRILRLSAAIAIAILTASPLFAIDTTSIQCGLNVVYLGDLDGNVLTKCGTPTYKGGLNRWIYDDGYSETYVVIHFGAGGQFRRRVMRIEIVNRRAP